MHRELSQVYTWLEKGKKESLHMAVLVACVNLIILCCWVIKVTQAKVVIIAAEQSKQQNCLTKGVITSQSGTADNVYYVCCRLI